MSRKVYSRVRDDVSKELDRALRKYPRWHSAHEGLAVVGEEFVEMMLEVFKRPKKRSVAKMRKEAVQLAAMAERFILEVCDNPRKDAFDMDAKEIRDRFRELYERKKGRR